MKNFINESAMERLLEEKGFDIMTNDKESVIDSIKVVEGAISLGYLPQFDEETGLLWFKKIDE